MGMRIPCLAILALVVGSCSSTSSPTPLRRGTGLGGMAGGGSANVGGAGAVTGGMGGGGGGQTGANVAATGGASSGSAGSGGAGGDMTTGTDGTGAGGGDGSGPCAGLCTNPVMFIGPSYASPNLGTGETCHQTVATLTGGSCSNFVSPRTFNVNDVTVACNGVNFNPGLKRNGGYCLQASTGQQAYASFTTY